MKGTRKDRRSKRIPATQRLLLTVLGPNGAELAKEIVSTVEVSQYGAHIRGRRILAPESEGVLTQLSSGRQARVRIAWQEKSTSHHGFLEAGVELLSGHEYWGVSFAEPVAEAAAAPASAGGSGGSGDSKTTTLQEILDELARQSGDYPGGAVLEAVWCGLVEQLETRKLISRDDLVKSIRSIAERTAAVPATAVR